MATKNQLTQASALPRIQAADYHDIAIDGFQGALIANDYVTLNCYRLGLDPDGDAVRQEQHLRLRMTPAVAFAFQAALRRFLENAAADGSIPAFEENPNA